MIENNFDRPPQKTDCQMNLSIKNFLIVISLAFIFQFVSGFLVAILTKGNSSAFLETSTGTLIMSVVNNFCYLLAIFLVYGFKNSITDFFAVKKKAIRVGVIWGLIALTMNFVVSLASNMWYQANDMSPAKQNIVQVLENFDGPYMLLTIGLTSLLIPVFEEILYRGVLQRTLQQRYSVRTGLIISSLLFAVMHFDWYQLPGLFVIGMCFGIAYNKTNSLLSPIIAHMVNNIFALALLFYV